MTFFFFLVKKSDSTAIISIISSFSEMHSKRREVYSDAGKTEERRKRIEKLLLSSFLLQIILHCS